MPLIPIEFSSNFLGKAWSPDKKTSSGAPLMIWAYKLPLDPLEINIWLLFFFSNWFLIIFIGTMKFEATPTYRLSANNSLYGKTPINSNGKKIIESLLCIILIFSIILNIN